jgi:integrase
LIEAAAAGPEHAGTTGPDRALAYQQALETGLRVREIMSLTRASFDFGANPARLVVKAAYSKHRCDDTILLRPELALRPQQALALKLPDGLAFPLPPSKNARAGLIQADLAAAGIAYRDQDGRYADWHALRHTFITNLARGGVHPRVAQSLARHCTITLTMDRYTHVLREQEVEALSRLPDLSVPPPAVESSVTGTDGA